MLKKERIERVQALLKEKDIHQVLVSDSHSIFYFLEKWFYPGERFLALLIKEEECVLFVNQLFRYEEELGIRNVYFSDNDPLMEVLEKEINPNLSLGVDKTLVAKFLLPMMQSKIAKEFVDGSFAVDTCRGLKDEEEIKKMRKASLVNDAAMERFKSLLKEGISEKQVAEQMLPIYQSLGASRYSFEPIVAFGKNGADPHHMPDDTTLKSGDMVLFDVGCVVEEYCSDMTRVFFFEKEPNDAQRKIYNLVRKANEEAIKKVEKEIKLCEIDKAARDVITEGGYGKDFTHRLGHFIGIEDHDFGDVSSNNQNLTKVGNIFSIEPGIYSLEEGIGVRIEDLVLVTEQGVEVLNHYPHDIEVIYTKKE